MTAPQYTTKCLQRTSEHNPCTSPTLLPSSWPGKWHPQFPLNDTDMVLRSLEGTLYGVYSYTLRKTCGFFATMFTLPRCESSKLSRDDDLAALDVYEHDSTLSTLLSLLFGLPITPWETLEQAEHILMVAEKWDAQGPITTIRSTLFVPHFLDTEPLRLYALTKHFEWDDEATTLIPFHTLKLNLYDPIHSDTLSQMSSKHILSLFELHRKRQEMFKELIESPERFVAGNSEPYICGRCGVTELDNRSWREYKQVLLVEIERRPLGDTIGLLSGTLSVCPEALACWNAKCPKEGCGGLNYDRHNTLEQIRHCLEMIPIE